MAYHKVFIKLFDIEVIALIFYVGLYKIKKMSFYLGNAPSKYKYFMFDVMQSLIGRISLDYLDDVIVFSIKQ